MSRYSQIRDVRRAPRKAFSAHTPYCIMCACGFVTGCSSNLIECWANLLSGTSPTAVPVRSRRSLSPRPFLWDPGLYSAKRRGREGKDAMDFSTLLSKVVIALVASIIGAMVVKLMAKRAVFRCSTRTERFARSMDSPAPSIVRVEWRGNPVTDLYMATLEVENTSSKDFENLGVTVYAQDGTRLLEEWSVVVGTPDRVKWSQDFEKQVMMEPADSPAQKEQKLQLWQTRREYLVPVLNRRQLLRLHFLCTPAQGGPIPVVLPNVSAPGVRMIYKTYQNFILRVPTELTFFPGIITSLLLVFAVITYLDNVVLVAAVSVLVGWLTLSIGAIVCRVYWWLRDRLFD